MRLQPCFGSLFAYAPNMPKPTGVSAKAKRGRPATGVKFPVIVQVRLSKAQSAEFDAWRERQFQHPTRSEAIRQLVIEVLRREHREERPRGNVQVADAGSAKRSRNG